MAPWNGPNNDIRRRRRRRQTDLEFGVDGQRFDDVELRLFVDSSSDHVDVVHVGRRLDEPHPVAVSHFALVYL